MKYRLYFAFLAKRRLARPLGTESHPALPTTDTVWAVRALPGDVWGVAPTYDAAVAKLRRSLEARFKLAGDPAIWWTEKRATMSHDDKAEFTSVVGDHIRDLSLPEGGDDDYLFWTRRELATA